MKDQPRGPFSGIKWFCSDGRVLAPKDYACAGKGQGWQHGAVERAHATAARPGLRWWPTCWPGSTSTRPLADPAFADHYAQWLVEKFLVAADDGWILRKAQFYRGAVQEEDEREAARRLLTALAAQPAWTGHRFVALRTGVRLLPHGADDASAQKVRNLAAALNDRDAELRAAARQDPRQPRGGRCAKRCAPGPAAPRTRSWPSRPRALAAEIDRVYAPQPFTQTLDARRAGPGCRTRR